MKKVGLLLTMFFLLFGCASNNDQEVVQESKDPFTIQFFYSKTCPHCKQLEEELLPEIEKVFKDQVTIERYDIDEEESEELYDQYIGVYNPDTDQWESEGLLANVSEDIASRNYYVPLMVISDQYAVMGYTSEFKDTYIQDIHLMLQGKPLTVGDISNGRWLFK